MPPATKTLSQAELTKLEHAFATDPVSEAYKPLAEAYLGMGRFMEAMVVCKKGVKAHPNRPDPRILLARVYADQGKDKKAVEELTAAMQIAPTDKGVLRMMGALQLKTGEADAGKANLLKAFEADPSDAETLEAMGKYGVPVPKEPEPPPPPPVSAPAPVVVAAALAPTPSVAATQHAAAPVQQAQQPQGQQAAARKPAATARPAQPQGRPTPQRREYDEESVSEATELPPRHKSTGSGGSRAMFFLLIFIVPLSAAGYYGFGQYKAKQIRDANKLLRDATDKLKTDTFAAYQVAIKAAEDALTVNASTDTNRIARGLLAYGYTVRWGEHQHDSDNREHALSNIKAGIESKDQSNYLAAAEALFDYYDGKSAEALKKIEERIKTAETEKKQVSIFYLTQGLILMNTGSLDDARLSLERAQIIAPDDPRVFVALGNLQRRRGADMVALTAFNNALKYTRNSHPDALLGTANLILDQENPGKGYITASQYVKTLLEMEPPPSPRELAEAHFVKALLISRVTTDLPQYKDEVFKKDLADKTGISGDKNSAAKEIDREEKEGLGLDQRNPELSLVKGRRLASEGKIDDAAVELRKAIEINGTAAHYHVELAKVLMRKEGGDPAAEEVLKKALSLVPNSPKLLTMLGQVQARQKKYADAEATLEKATSDEKARNPDARFLLGKLLRDDKKDYERAIKLIDRAAGEYFNDSGMAATAYDDLGVTLELRNKDGDKDRARGAYEKSFGYDKEYAPVLCHYVKFLTRLNDPKEKDKLKSLTDGLKAADPQNTCLGGGAEKPKEG
jgi:tetratricopeptide (TPR) repeat protein